MKTQILFIFAFLFNPNTDTTFSTLVKQHDFSIIRIIKNNLLQWSRPSMGEYLNRLELQLLED